MKININMGSLTILFFIFLVLKLTEIIDWSWWWIFSPYLIPLSIIFILIPIIYSIIIIVVFIQDYISGYLRKK